MRDAGKFLKATLFVVVAVTTFLVTAAAWAADRVVVLHAEGPDADALAKDVTASLPKGTVASDAKEFHGELAKQGQKGPFGKALDSAKQRETLLERVRKAARAANVDVVVILRVKKDKQGRTVTILVIDPKTAAPLRDDEVSLPAKKGTDDSKPVLASVGPALGVAPAPAEEKKAEEKQPEAKTAGPKAEKTEEPAETEAEKGEGARETGEISRALFVVGAGLDLGMRRFTYNDGLTNNLRKYSVNGAPLFAVDLELYPLAGRGAPMGDLGVVGLYARAFALKSALAGGDKFDTTWERWFAGLRYRLRTSGDHGPVVGLTVGYGHEGFTFSGMPDKLAAEVPAQSYRFVKIAADARVPLGAFALFAGAGYLVTSAEGDDLTTVAGRFPHAKVGGIEANLGAGYTLTRGLEARVVARYTRFFWSMHPEPGEAYVAGGALDELASLHLGVAYAY